MILLPTSPQSDNSSCITAVLMKKSRFLLFDAIKNTCPRQPSECSMGRNILSQKGCLCSFKTSSGWNPVQLAAMEYLSPDEQIEVIRGMELLVEGVRRRRVQNES